MGISYAEVLIALVLTLLAGLLLLGASGDAQTIHTYVKERNVASSIMYEQLYNAPWYSETATSFVVHSGNVDYGVTRSVSLGCSSLGASAEQISNCESNFKETTVTVHWKDHSITGTRVSRLLP